MEHHFGTDRTDLPADHIITDQNRQHPVRAFHRFIAKVLRRSLILEGDLAGHAVLKILFHLLIVVPFINIRLFQRRKEILSLRQITEIIISQTFATAVIQAAVGFIVTALQCQGT